MHHIKTGITAREIMNKNFPIIDSSPPLKARIKKMNHEHGACLIIKGGNFLGIISKNEIVDVEPLIFEDISVE